MTVYLDDAFLRGPWGVFTGGGHLQADSLEELVAFGDALGMPRRLLQLKPGRPERDHYDIPGFLREQAVALGAVEVGSHASAARRAQLRDASQSESGPSATSAKRGSSVAPAASSDSAIST
jgi:hypothetical protein